MPNVKGHRAAYYTCMEVRDNSLELMFLLLAVIEIKLRSSSLDQQVCPLSHLINHQPEVFRFILSTCSEKMNQ